MQAFRMLGAVALAIASLVIISAAIMPTQGNDMAMNSGFRPHDTPTPVPMVGAAIDRRIIPTAVPDFASSLIIDSKSTAPARSLVLTGNEHSDLNDALVHTDSGAPSAANPADLSIPANAMSITGASVVVTTFETMTTTAAPAATIEKKQAGCYVTTLNGSQDKITKTICPAPAPACTPRTW
ncbi:hypothetical protein LTR08_008111 [Meristemomyces frigidus]|nr:hypothetical protein LTR08_008111 [Meristemomyces frigidus]